jgi:Activator of Hsp90 ATPase homolog 1-like protein
LCYLRRQPDSAINYTQLKGLAMNPRADEKIKIIDAAPAQVFEAISDPNKLTLWWGPDGFSNTFHAFDFRQGGSWRFTMHGPDGRNYENENCFREIQENRKVVIEHIYEPHFILTIELSGSGNETQVSWQQLFDSPEQYQSHVHIVSMANQQNLDKLERVVMQGA